jgi:hypothetical protein
MSSITVLFYSKHGPASLKLFDIIQEYNFLNITCIPADNSNIRKRLLNDGITELPALFWIESNGEKTTLIGKECFLYIQDILDEMIEQKAKKTEKFTPLENNGIIRADGDSGSNMVTNNSKIGRNLASQQINTNRNTQQHFKDETEYDDTKRTIKNEEAQFQLSSGKSFVKQPPPNATIIDDNDFSSEPPPNIPSPLGPSSRSNSSIDDDDDPSGMNLGKNKGSATSIAGMLESSRGEIKIVKHE